MSILNIIIEFMQDIPPWFMIEPDQAGVLIRGGKLKKKVEPGFYFKLPIYDKVRAIEVIDQVIKTPSCSFQTKDGTVITIRIVIRYEIEDVEAAILAVQDFDDALPEMAMDAAASYISNSKLKDCSYNKLSSEITDSLRTDAADWGLNIYPIWIVELCKSKVLRLILGDSI